jgi:hypothetical protein
MSFKNNANADMENSYEFDEWGNCDEWDEHDNSLLQEEYFQEFPNVDDYDDVEDSRRYVTGKLNHISAPKPIAFKSIIKIDKRINKDEDVVDNSELVEYKEVMKTKLNWLTKPTVVEVEYDSDDSDFEETKPLKSSISDDDYPSLSSELFKQKKTKKEVAKKEEVPRFSKDTDTTAWISVNNKKKKKEEKDTQISFEFTKPCLTWIEGTKCCRKGCTYAHSEKELKINDCNFKNCNMVIENDGCFSNKNSDRFCNKIHRHESVDNFLERLGVKKTKVVKHNIPEELNYALSLLSKEKFIEFEGVKYFGQLSPDVKKEEPKKKEKTQMCRSVKEKTKCPHKNNCRYAHTFDELVVSLCGFNEKCRGISINGKGQYVNSTNGKVCCYRHPKETKDNYRKRVNV